MIRAVTMHEAVCDGCRAEHTDDGYGHVLVWPTAAEAVDAATVDGGWHESAGKLICPDCQQSPPDGAS